MRYEKKMMFMENIEEGKIEWLTHHGSVKCVQIVCSHIAKELALLMSSCHHPFSWLIFFCS